MTITDPTATPIAPTVLTYVEGGTDCPGCGAAPGEPHRDCDHALCIRCGVQAIQCDEHEGAPAQTHTGEWPGVAECREYGLWSRWTIVTEYSRDGRPDSGPRVVCEPDHTDAGPDYSALTIGAHRGLFVWSQGRQRYVTPEQLGYETAARAAVYDPGHERVLFHVDSAGPDGGAAPPMAMSTARATVDDIEPWVRVVSVIARTIEGDPERDGSSTQASLRAGPHGWGKKIVEEAAELWLAIEHEDDDAVALEASQLLYRLLVGVMGRGVHVRDVLAQL